MDQNQLKQAVAQAAVDYSLTRLKMTVLLVLARAQRPTVLSILIAKHKHKFQGTVASSEGSAERLRSHGIQVFELNAVSEVTIYIDGADEANASP